SPRARGVHQMNPRAIPRRPRIIPISLVRTTLARMTLASAVAVRLLCIGAPARAEQVKETHPLLGASLEITVDSPDLETGQNRIRDAISVATVLESELIPGNEGNDVGKLNASAGLGVRTVPLDLYRLLALSQVMTRSTGDAFDVTIGPLLRRRQPARPETATPGEQHTAADGSFGQPPAASGSFSQPPAAGGSFSMDEALSLVGADKIVLHPPNRVELPSAGMSVDFSAIVRGYVLERMAVALRAGGTTSALLAFADTTMLVIGPPAGEPPVRVWVPRGRSMAGSVALRDMSMSTARAHRRSDDPRPPIVDPRSGRV